jgi:predicted homoserine dehydrogenase-like protein
MVPVCEDGRVLAECGAVDVVIESSSDIVAGGAHAEAAIAAGHPVVMMNAEADLIFGPYLLSLARRHGVVYTTSDGDQPGVIRRLITEEVERWGFELVMAGNMKGFLDRRANPISIVPEAEKRNFDPRMTAGFTDGSKLAIEMAIVANALGLRTTVTGMIGPRVADVRDVPACFDFDAIRGGGAAVDYVLGAQPDGGVFAVGYSGSRYQQSMLATFKMGPGPYYVFYRPYHLCHVQAMATVLDAARGETLLAPRFGFRTNVIAYAKEPLRAGIVLDGFGGHACYGLIENIDAASDGLPLCLADAVTLTRDVARDERVTLADVRYDPASPGFAMFAKAVEASAAGLVSDR